MKDLIPNFSVIVTILKFILQFIYVNCLWQVSWSFKVSNVKCIYFKPFVKLWKSSYYSPGTHCFVVIQDTLSSVVSED